MANNTVVITEMRVTVRAFQPCPVEKRLRHLRSVMTFVTDLTARTKQSAMVLHTDFTAGELIHGPGMPTSTITSNLG
jgi:hypothetical protein